MASAEEAEEEAPAAPEPVVRYSTFDREADRTQALVRALHDDEVVVAGSDDERHWRVYRTAPGASRGVVVLAAPANQPPDAAVVRTVRTLLPRSGWSTLTLAMPAEPVLRNPPRDRSAKGGALDVDAPDGEEAGDSEAEIDAGSPATRKRPQPTPFDRGPLDAANDELLTEHQQRVGERLRDAVADARTRAQGRVVVVMASGAAAGELAVNGADLGADVLVLVDVNVEGSGQEALRSSLAELNMPALILQHAPHRWRPEHGLGPKVEMHLLPARSEVRLARRVAGYLRRNYGAN